MPKTSIIQRRLDREIRARKQAELVLEKKALELYEANNKLSVLNAQLAEEVEVKSTKLEIQEKQYKKLVEEASDFIINFSKSLKFTYVNVQAEKLLGLSKEELLTKTIVDFVHPQYLEQAGDFFYDFNHRELNEPYIELPITANNKVIWLGLSVNLVQEGNAEYYSTIARDITQRRKIEAELEKAMSGLERSEHKYRGILQNLKLGIVETDVNGIVVAANEIFQNLIGYSEEEILGKTPEESYVHNNDNQGSLVSVGGDDTQVSDLRLMTKDGTIINVLISAAPVHDMEGNLIGSIGIHYDITELRKLTRDLEIAKNIAEEAQRAEQKFLAVMTHEIRTPLNAIVGMSHLLKDTSLDNEQSEYVGLINNAADILQSLVTDVLDLSKIESGKIEVQKQDFELIQHLDNVFKTVKMKYAKPKVELIFDNRTSDQLWVNTDKKIVHQIVTNLLDNALKFTEEGKVALVIESKSPTEVKLTVTDTGIGISENRKQAIFEEFEQADESIQGLYGGTGLGLAICQKLATLLNTRLGVDSKLGEGAEFSIMLPIKAANAQVFQTQTTQTELAINKSTILIAEDNLMNQKYVTKLLEKRGIDYVLANDGKEAVAIASQKKYDLILMDIQMPQMTGVEATTVIRKGNGPNAKTPIIALTASTLVSQRTKAFEVGMDEFLSKPFRPEQLYNVIENYSGVISDKEGHHIEIDEAYIAEYYGDDDEYKLDMFNTFLESTPFELDKLDQLSKHGDLESLGQVAHKIKPTFTMVGIAELTEFMLQIEQAARKGDEGARTLVDKYMNSLRDGVELIQKEVKKISQK